MKKKLVFFLLLFTGTSFAQQTITSIVNGNASSPTTWDCLCFPDFNDHVVINHKVNLDVNWMVNSSGSITVNSGGELKQVGLKDLLIDGTSSKITNNGYLQVNRLAITNAAIYENHNHFSITEAFYVDANSSMWNDDLMDGLDSFMVEGIGQNDGDLFTGNFLNTGSFTNTGTIVADSLGNTGTFYSNNGWIKGTAIGNSGDFFLQTNGVMIATENWWNIGNFTIDADVQLFCEDNLYNGDTLGGYASLTNNGEISVSNSFYNGWNLNGSGSICIAEESYNGGDITGTLDICDNTGNDFDLSIGTIAGTITYCQSGCSVGIEEKSNDVMVYPNPTVQFLNLEAVDGYEKYQIVNLAGQTLMSGDLNMKQIDLQNLKNGAYFLILQNGQEKMSVRITKL